MSGTAACFMNVNIADADCVLALKIPYLCIYAYIHAIHLKEILYHHALLFITINNCFRLFVRLVFHICDSQSLWTLSSLCIICFIADILFLEISGVCLL